MSERLAGCPTARVASRAPAAGAAFLPPVLHGGNGSSLKATTVLATLNWPGVKPAHSRPRVGNDKVHAESLFGTAVRLASLLGTAPAVRDSKTAVPMSVVAQTLARPRRSLSLCIAVASPFRIALQDIRWRSSAQGPLG